MTSCSIYSCRSNYVWSLSELGKYVFVTGKSRGRRSRSKKKKKNEQKQEVFRAVARTPKKGENSLQTLQVPNWRGLLVKTLSEVHFALIGSYQG